MKLIFVRHGHTDASADTIPDPKTGEVDEPLNAEGIQQANDLAETLKLTNFDVVLSSPLKRAYQTAEIANKYHGFPVTIDDVWRERGIGEYVTVGVWHKLFDFDEQYSLENSEDLLKFFHRIYAGLDTLKAEYEDKTILLVSHTGVHQAIYTYANNLPLEGDGRVEPLDNCECRIYNI